ncbi:ANTAR domain-containing protein [Modestobacter sp. I12A-02628]|uniref:GAF and ANTAR domain-containing protein n=1 Tax=Goekera deserti TaxID=2497753 RepID=A0A7K3WF91_9ACTN|nr:GAF and ANTAR domain-containing protein [Goekera deserti]MPR00015.1 ANTAR domain-containing protein [Goekera deserti]NDI49793.1 ANTAR domain-containing protein [Goekera deserti]NEL55155.1 GAF and ANTAR domain-containing protein [Goekera deserti]
MPITAQSSSSLAEGARASGLSAEALYRAQLALTGDLTPTQVQAMLDDDLPDVTDHDRSAVEAAVNDARIDREAVRQLRAGPDLSPAAGASRRKTARSARPGDHVSMTEGPASTPRPGADADDVLPQLADLARSLQGTPGVQGRLETAVRAALVTIPGAEQASVSAVRDHREVHTLAATGPAARELDQSQYDTGQGPCLDTLFGRHTVRLEDLAAESRWPAFTARARQLGVGSMLSVQLFVDGQHGELGALTVSSSAPRAFTGDSELVALAVAAHAAVAVAEALSDEHLRAAVVTRDVIGMAKGVLVERYKVTPDQAFALLAAASQRTNRKLHTVADELVTTGALPTGPGT